MKLYLCSDVHIEFGPLEVHNNDNADVLILSGDIVVASVFKNYDVHGIIEPTKKAQDFLNFFHQCSTKFKDVIYVMGNHEHYDGDFATSADILRTVLKQYPNIHLLDKEVRTIEDVTFIGGTLWTDMNKEDPLTIYQISRMMNDFNIIKNSRRKSTRKVPIYKRDEQDAVIMGGNQYVVDHYESKEYASAFSPEDAVEDHKLMLKFIDKATKDSTKKYVVVGHHSPSKTSTKPRYQNDIIMNGGYSSDLSEFILDRPQIKLWTHGHTHDVWDYMIGSTRITCNPRGYIKYENRANEFDFLLLEV
jgi:Icc-related predicted phosphoesterase